MNGRLTSFRHRYTLNQSATTSPLNSGNFTRKGATHVRATICLARIYR